LKLVKIVLVALIFTINTFSQGHFVSGIITDSISGLPLQDANVLVILLPDSITYGTASSTNGNFKIEKLHSGRYILSVRYVGYKTMNFKFQIKNNDIDLGIIRLSHTNIETDTVLVIEKLPLVILKGDTLEYNSSAYKTRPDEYAEDLVKKLPGISVQGKKIYAEGKEVKTVLVNGENFLLDKPDEVLKKIPAEAVKKVQVYDKKSEEAEFSGIEDGEKEKAINLITKKKEGIFGKANLGAGTDKRYDINGDMNSISESRRIGISAALNNTASSGFSGSGAESQEADASYLISDGIGKMKYIKAGYSEDSLKNLKLSASYSYSSSGNELIKQTDRSYRAGILQDQDYLERSNSNNNFDAHNINARIEYKLDSLTAIFFQPTISIWNSIAAQSLSGLQIFKTNTLNSIETFSNTNGDEFRTNNMLMIKRALNEEGRTLLANFSFYSNNNKSTDNFHSANIFYDDPALSDTLDQNSQNKNLNIGFSTSLAWQEPIDKKQNLSLNLAYDYNKDNVNDITANNGQAGIIDSSFSNVYDNFLSNYTLEGGYTLKNDNINIFSSLNYDVSNLENNQTIPYATKVNKTYHSINASLDINYELSTNKTLMFELRNNSTIPQASMLQTVIDNRNPLYLSTGNPDLGKMSTYVLGLSYRSVNQSESSFFSLQGSLVFVNGGFGYNRVVAFQDTIVLHDINLKKGVQISYPLNLDGGKRVWITASYGFLLEPIKSKIEFDINGRYNAGPTMVNNSETNTDIYGISFGIKLSGYVGNIISYYYNGSIRDNSRNYGISSDQNNYLSYYHSINIKSLLLGRINLYSSIFVFHDNSLPEEIGKTTSIIDAGVGLKLFKDMAGELRLEGHNLTDENSNNYSREYDAYIEDTTSNTIGRYFLLTFIYQLKNL
jgi:CarboxypepD_reg-like domain